MPQPVGQPTITIDPAAIPAGTELSIGIFQLSSGVHLQYHLTGPERPA
jgi:hypothetical protein